MYCSIVSFPLFSSIKLHLDCILCSKSITVDYMETKIRLVTKKIIQTVNVKLPKQLFLFICFVFWTHKKFQENHQSFFLMTHWWEFLFPFSKSHLCDEPDILRSAICTCVGTALRLYWLLLDQSEIIPPGPFGWDDGLSHTFPRTQEKNVMIFLKRTKQLSKACSIKVF